MASNNQKQCPICGTIAHLKQVLFFKLRICTACVNKVNAKIEESKNDSI